jgi:hypothetical protein
VWLSFTVAILALGVVGLLTGGASTQPVGVWIAFLAVVSVVCLLASEVFGRRPLDCSDLAALAASYRSRFFLRTAFSEAIALFAFVATLIVGQWWIYWLFVPFTLFGFGQNAPTTGRVRAEQERLRLQGASYRSSEPYAAHPPCGRRVECVATLTVGDPADWLGAQICRSALGRSVLSAWQVGAHPVRAVGADLKPGWRGTFSSRGRGASSAGAGDARSAGSGSGKRRRLSSRP